MPELEIQGSQVSLIWRETHAFGPFLTHSALNLTHRGDQNLAWKIVFSLQICREIENFRFYV
jgi:hypothetical protein